MTWHDLWNLVVRHLTIKQIDVQIGITNTVCLTLMGVNNTEIIFIGFYCDVYGGSPPLSLQSATIVIPLRSVLAHNSWSRAPEAIIKQHLLIIMPITHITQSQKGHCLTAENISADASNLFLTALQMSIQLLLAWFSHKIFRKREHVSPTCVCHCSAAVVTPVKHKPGFINWTYNFIPSRCIYSMETLS